MAKRGFGGKVEEGIGEGAKEVEKLPSASDETQRPELTQMGEVDADVVQLWRTKLVRAHHLVIGIP